MNIDLCKKFSSDLMLAQTLLGHYFECKLLVVRVLYFEAYCETALMTFVSARAFQWLLIQTIQ
jgi:hypothetical protein